MKTLLKSIFFLIFALLLLFSTACNFFSPKTYDLFFDKLVNSISMEQESNEPPEGIYYYEEIAQSSLTAINKERQEHGMDPLKAHQDLTSLARWTAASSLQHGSSNQAHELTQNADTFPSLASTAISKVSSWSSANYSQKLIDWFAESNLKDVKDSVKLRQNLLNPDHQYVAVATAGIAQQDGQYKIATIWLFMPSPPAPGITFYNDIAQKNLTSLNTARRNHGLDDLKVHPQLVDLAKKKAEDLIANDYFAHDSPRLGSPHQMIMNNVSPSPSMTGENLWMVTGTFHAAFLDGIGQKSHQGLMDSPGHRENILKPEFTHAGIASAGGVVNRPDGKVYKVVVVQLFTRQ